MQCMNTQHTCHLFVYGQMLINDWSMGFRKSSSSTHSVSSHHPTQVVSHRDDWERRVGRNSNHWNRIHIPRRFYMIGSHHRACLYSQIHMCQVFQDDHLLLMGWCLTKQVEQLVMMVWLVGKSCFHTHSVSSHHPIQEVWHQDDWERRAGRNSNHWNRIHIPHRFYMIGSHRQACRCSVTHMCQVFQDDHLLLRGWCLTKQAEQLLMMVWLMGKLCSRTHSVSSHHPIQEVWHQDDWERRVGQNSNHWNRIHIPRRSYMIGSHHLACRYSQRHMCEVFQ